MWVALQLSLPKGEVGAYVRANASAYTCASMCLQTLRSFTQSWRNHTETLRALAFVHACMQRRFKCSLLCACAQRSQVFMRTGGIHANEIVDLCEWNCEFRQTKLLLLKLMGSILPMESGTRTVGRGAKYVTQLCLVSDFLNTVLNCIKFVIRELFPKILSKDEF